jgi:DNA-binding XRE family transcriptional regulator
MELESETMRGQQTICAIENADVANPTLILAHMVKFFG